MTILTVESSDGTRRCDATCHRAVGATCLCCCGGRYHGKGSSEAAQTQLTEDMLGPQWEARLAAMPGNVTLRPAFGL